MFSAVTPGSLQKPGSANTRPREIPVKPFDDKTSCKFAHHREVACKRRVALARHDKCVLPKAKFANVSILSFGRGAEDFSATTHTPVADEKVSSDIMQPVSVTPSFKAVNNPCGSAETQMTAQHQDDRSSAETGNSWTSDDMIFEMDP